MKESLIARAKEAKEAAYAPYSGFRVGAALLSEDGAVYTGCNVENASYGATICAERTAAVKAVSEGKRRFVAMAIATDAQSYTPPCGICRQFLSEFADDMEIYLIKGDDSVMITRLIKLFPDGFTKEDLQ